MVRRLCEARMDRGSDVVAEASKKSGVLQGLWTWSVVDDERTVQGKKEKGIWGCS